MILKACALKKKALNSALKGGERKVNSVEKGIFKKQKFSDTDSVSLFSKFPFNKATFEQCFLKFVLKILKIERVLVNLRRRLEKNCFVVYTITRNRIRRNEKIQMHLLKDMFLDVTLGAFYF